jgi:hypothetical protein
MRIQLPQCVSMDGIHILLGMVGFEKGIPLVQGVCYLC